MTGGLPRLAVVLDFGAASPMSILAAARGLAEIVFLCDRDLPAVRAVFDDLHGLAPVRDITGRSDDEIDAILGPDAVAGITTFSEGQLNRTAGLAHRRALTFLSPQTARTLTDKYLQRQTLARAHVQHTSCRIVRGVAGLDAALADVGLPAILKPRSGAASALTCRVDDRRQAQARLREFLSFEAAGPERDFVVEQLLTGDASIAGPEWGDYVSVESVTSHGEIRHIEITGKLPLAEPLRETGYVVPCTLDQDMRGEILALTSAALSALDVRHGATHVEIKLTPQGPRIIEVNGRVGGYVADLIRRARGFDLIRAALGAALGRAADVPQAGYRRHTFQYFLTPPMNALRLRRFDGTGELARVRGLNLEILKNVGDAVDWRHGTLTYVGIVHGSGRDHHEVLRLIELINRTMRIEYAETDPPETG